jgi:hypothetical protein
MGTLGLHIDQDNRRTRQEEYGQAYTNLHQRPGSGNVPQQMVNGNQLQKTGVGHTPLATLMQSIKDSRVNRDVVCPGFPAVEHQQKKEVGQVSRNLPRITIPMSSSWPQTISQGHNSMVQRAPPAIASNSNNAKPSNRPAAQFGRLRAEYFQKTQEIQKIRQEYAKLQQAQCMQAIHDGKETAVNTNPAIDIQSKNDHDQTDTMMMRVIGSKLKNALEIEEGKKAYKREHELALARARVPVLINKEPVHDDQLSVPMVTAEATQRRLSMLKNGSPAPPQLQEKRKRILDWLEFT